MSYLSLKRAVSACLLLAATMLPFSAHAKTELLMSSSIYSTNWWFDATLNPFFDRFGKATNGDVSYIYYEPGTLVPDKEVLQATIDGVIDMTYAIPTASPNMFPMSVVFEYPMLFSSYAQTALTYDALVQENPVLAAEWKDVTFLWAGGSSPMNIVSTMPIKNLDDLKGKRIGVRAAAISDVIKLLGAVPVLLPMSDMYISLNRGLVDGVLMPMPQLIVNKIPEVAKHITMCGLLSSVGAVVMNTETYERFSPAAKKFIDAVRGPSTTVLEASWGDYRTARDLKTMVSDYGLTVHELAPAERQRWSDAVMPMYEPWKANMRKLGHDPEALLKAIKDKAAYYTPERIKQIADDANKNSSLKGLLAPEI